MTYASFWDMPPGTKPHWMRPPDWMALGQDALSGKIVGCRCLPDGTCEFVQAAAGLEGLGQVRCPLPPQAANVPKDPCERRYEFDIPIWGRTDIGVPLTQMTDDAFLQARGYVPMLVFDATKAAEPFVDEKIADAMAEISMNVPRWTEQALKSPEIQRQKELMLAQAEALRDEALKVAVALTGIVVMAVGFTAWWIKRR